MTAKGIRRIRKVVTERNSKVKLDISEICSIIKTCKKNNVLSLKVEGLELSMELVKEDDFAYKQIPVSNTKETRKYPETLTPDEEQAIRSQYDEFEIEHIKLTDPEEYERLLAGDLNDQN